jgi:hypothetical protein
MTSSPELEKAGFSVKGHERYDVYTGNPQPGRFIR